MTARSELDDHERVEEQLAFIGAHPERRDATLFQLAELAPALHQRVVAALAQDDEKGKAAEPFTDADRVIYTNIVAAQNELDELILYFENAKMREVKQIEDKLTRANLYLMEALDTMPQGSKTSPKIAGALASFHGAEIKVDNVIHLRAIGGPADDDAAYDGLRRGSMARLREREGTLMRTYGVPAKPAHGSTVGKGKDGKAPEVEAMKASLHLADVETARGFHLLASHTGDFASRVTIVKHTEALVAHHLGHASMMMMGPAFDRAQLAALKPTVQSVSKQVLRMKRWIDGRQGNAAMATAFYSILATMNGTRARVGLDEVDLDATEGFPEREEAEESLERAEMTAAVGKFAEAWETVRSQMNEGVDQWFALAQKSEQAKPGFLEGVLEALVITAFGNFTGVLVKNMFAVADHQKLKAAIQDLVGGVANDALQMITTPAIQEAVGKSGTTKDPDLKALLYVKGGLKKLCDNTVSQHVSKLHDNVAAGTLSILEVQGLEKCARATAAKVTDQVKFQSATNWVRYVAQSSLKGRQPTSAPNPTGGSVASEVTDLGGYFGELHKGGARGDQTGNAGMLRVEVKNYEDGLAGRIGDPRIVALKVNGLNKEMAELILSDNVRTLDDVKVPKEVHVEFKVPLQRTTVRRPALKMAIDENGKISDSLEMPDEGTTPPETVLIWEKIRRIVIPNDAIK